MNNEKIMELVDTYSHQYIFGDCWEFEKDGLISLVQAVIKEERENSESKLGWNAGQKAERGRIKSRVKEAAENLWCIRNEVVEEVDGELKRVPYSLYIGPSINTLEEFVNRLLEET